MAGGRARSEGRKAYEGRSLIGAACNIDSRASEYRTPVRDPARPQEPFHVEAVRAWNESLAEAGGDGGVVIAVLLLGSPVQSQPSKTLSIPAESPRWELEGQAEATQYQGRKCLSLDGGAAVLKDLEMRDGVIDVDVSTPASRGFFGIDFRITDNGANGERVYLRQHKSGLPDAMQYTPVLAVSELGGGWGFICRLTDPES
jgi:hypothetical protein